MSRSVDTTMLVSTDFTINAHTCTVEQLKAVTDDIERVFNFHLYRIGALWMYC